MDMMLVSSRMSMAAIHLNASAHILIKLWSVSCVLVYDNKRFKNRKWTAKKSKVDSSDGLSTFPRLISQILPQKSVKEILQFRKILFINFWTPVTISMMSIGRLIQIRKIFGIKILSMVNTLLHMNWTPVWIRNWLICYQRYVCDLDP